jgi:hypothetical protein
MGSSTSSSSACPPGPGKPAGPGGPCGCFYSAGTGRTSPSVTAPPIRWPGPQPADQVSQRQQVIDGERAPAIRDDHERTGGHDIGLPCWQREQHTFSSCRWTRSSPEFWRCAMNSKSWSASGWNGCVTRTRRYRSSGPGVVDDAVQLLRRAERWVRTA